MGVSLILLKILFASHLVKKESEVRQFLRTREKEAIKDKLLLSKCLLSLAIVLTLFATEEIHHLRPALSALIGATVTLILVRPEPKKIFSEIEWPVIFFFIALYIMVGGVDEAGTLL